MNQFECAKCGGKEPLGDTKDTDTVVCANCLTIAKIARRCYACKYVVFQNATTGLFAGIFLSTSVGNLHASVCPICGNIACLNPEALKEVQPTMN